jgi:uncharacterized protein (DUF2062 family)
MVATGLAGVLGSGMADGFFDRVRKDYRALRRERLSLNPLVVARRLWRVMIGRQATPARLAVAVGMGLLIGSLPIYPHTLICIVVCVAFRLNVMVAWLGTNISNPLVAPALYFVEIQVGHLLLEGQFGVITLTEMREMGLSAVLQKFFVYCLVGSMLVGPALSGIAGGLAYAALKRRQERRGGSDGDDGTDDEHAA